MLYFFFFAYSWKLRSLLLNLCGWSEAMSTRHNRTASTTYEWVKRRNNFLTDGRRRRWNSLQNRQSHTQMMNICVRNLHCLWQYLLLSCCCRAYTSHIHWHLCRSAYIYERLFCSDNTTVCFEKYMVLLYI